MRYFSFSSFCLLFLFVYTICRKARKNQHHKKKRLGTRRKMLNFKISFVSILFNASSAYAFSDRPSVLSAKLIIFSIVCLVHMSRDSVKIPHTQGYVACNTNRSGYLKPTQPSRLGLPLALWFVRIQARCHLCSHNSTWKSFRVAAASGHLTGTAYGQAVKP